MFTRVETDSEAGEGSTARTGATGTAEAFGERLHAEALTRGLLHGELVVLLGDGAHWTRNMAAPSPLSLVSSTSAVRGNTPPGETGPDARNGRGGAGYLRRILSYFPRKRMDAEIERFNNHTERTRYAEFRARGLLVGSRLIEAGCKNIIAARLKKPGARWPVRGANDIIALRCTLASSRFEDHWARRATG